MGKRNIYLTMNKSLFEEDIIRNVHAANNCALKHMKQKLVELKEEIDKSIILGRDLNITLSVIDRTSRQKTRNDTLIEHSNNTINHLGLTDIEQSL